MRQMLDDLSRSVEADAETESELIEGLRVLGRATTLCSELSLDVDVETPSFFSMNTELLLHGHRGAPDRWTESGRRVLPGPSPEERMRVFLADNPGDGGGGRYRLADTGRDAGRLREQAEPYQRYFAMPSEPVT
jgi:hypothetical protein